MIRILIALIALACVASAQITTIQGSDTLSTSRTTINDNFSYLNTQVGLKLTSPATTKGDLIGYNGSAHARLAVGTNNYCLMADSTTATGLKWDVCAGSSSLPSQTGNASKVLTTDGTNASWSFINLKTQTTWTDEGTSGRRVFITKPADDNAFDLRQLTTSDIVSGTLPTARGGTGLTSGTSGGILAFTASGTLASSGALTANMPVIGGGAGVAPSVGTKSGNSTVFVTTTGTQTSGRCVEIDANGNHVAASDACGSGGGGASDQLDLTDGLLTRVGDTSLGVPAYKYYAPGKGVVSVSAGNITSIAGTGNVLVCFDYAGLTAVGTGTVTFSVPAGITDGGSGSACPDGTREHGRWAVTSSVLAASQAAGEDKRLLLVSDDPCESTDTVTCEVNPLTGGKQYSTSGGGSISGSMLHNYYFPAGGVHSSTSVFGGGWGAPSSNGATTTTTASGTIRYVSHLYADGAAALSASLAFRLPDNWDNSKAVSLALDWGNGSGAGAGIFVSVATGCTSNGEATVPSLNTSQDTTLTPISSSNWSTYSISTLTMTGCAAGDRLFIVITRDPTNVADDLAGNWLVLGATVKIYETITQ